MNRRGGRRSTVSGFTLIELLLVIAIIGMLASIVLASMSKARLNARDTARISSLNEVNTALQMYYDDHRYYPKYNATGDISDQETNWMDMLTALRTGKYIGRAEELNRKRAELAATPFQRFITALTTPIQTVFAATLHPEIQDPNYPSATYSYMPASHPTPFTNYRIRAQLENPNNPILASSLTGYFMWNDEPTGDDACDPSLGYYCTGPSDSFVPFDPGKPVIYLYPTETTSVSVHIYPKRIEQSVPDYDNGWNVVAHPDGSIVDDGKTYPYLFWEGQSDAPIVDRSKGAVVATGELKPFLQKALADQGLKSKEISDFVEYWLPRMTTDKPYVYVYFMPQEYYDALVPIEVTPEPDTLIRIYMLFKPLTATVAVTPQVFHAPARTGFTVVEWGGDRSELQ